MIEYWGDRLNSLISSLTICARVMGDFSGSFRIMLIRSMTDSSILATSLQNFDRRPASRPLHAVA